MKPCNINNKAIIYSEGKYIDISRALPYNERVDFFSKVGINFNHYKDNMYGYYNKELGWCARYVKLEVVNNKLRCEIIKELFDELNKAIYRYKPDMNIRFKYDSLWNKYEFSYPSICGSSYPHNPYKDFVSKIFNEKIIIEGFDCRKACIRADNSLENEIKATIKRLNKLLPDKIRVEQGKTYRMNQQYCIGTRWEFDKDAEFTVISSGYNWSNHTTLQFNKGKLRTTVHSSFFNTTTLKLNDYSGRQKFLSKEELSIKLGVDIHKLIIGFDPYGNGAYLPCKEIHN